MTRTKARRMSVSEFETGLARPGARDVFRDDELVGLPAPVQRYFRAAIAPGTPLALAARLEMHGSIKIGGRWLPFRAASRILLVLSRQSLVGAGPGCGL